jgi:uncharacterized damage-inducible protein DinB
MAAHRQTARGISAGLATFARATAGGRNWGHTGLTGILKNVGVDEAVWKPAPDGHSIWEELNHIAYWSEDVLDQLEGRSQPRPQAWPEARGSADEWRRAVERTRRLHARLVRRIAASRPAALARKSQKTRYTNEQLILGGIAHIAYHTGRIALLRKLFSHARAS